ncbi:MAG: 16S rRNA (adenine(1518)-N(6)/adenine(1519)-N(6)) -dimethyltransferase RsmA [Anaerolineae bacterium]
MASSGEPSLSVRRLLDKYNLHPRKGLGQHFLADPNILRKIVEAAGLSSEETVLEIGPGLGTLTRCLAQAARRVVAVELDQNLVAVLKTELSYLPNLEVVHGDILHLAPGELLRGPHAPDPQLSPDYTVVANLPYYITSAVIRHLLEADAPPRRLVLTVQYEVARRIVAVPDDMNLLAVSVQFYGQPRVVARIPAGAFIPPPKVDSAVVRIDTYSVPPFDAPAPEVFFRVVRAGFAQKRKQLKNALGAGLGLPVADVADIMAQAGIEPQRRAETLSLAEWADLAREFGQHPSFRV